MIKIRNFTLFVVAAALAATPGWAGDDDHYSKKCSADTGMCMRKMVAKLSEKGWIGIEWENEAEIPVLTQVFDGSPAESAGLLLGDKVLAFNDVSTSMEEETVWAEVKKSLVPGNTITLTIERNGVKKKVDVLLVPLPRHVIAQWIGNHVLDHHLVAENSEDSDNPEDTDASP